jgi:hypothetical protein
MNLLTDISYDKGAIFKMRLTGRTRNTLIKKKFLSFTVPFPLTLWDALDFLTNKQKRVLSPSFSDSVAH